MFPVAPQGSTLRDFVERSLGLGPVDAIQRDDSGRDFSMGRTFATPGDRRMGQLGSANGGANGGTVVGIGSMGFIDVGRAYHPTPASVRPNAQLHSINPRTGELDTWLFAGKATRYSRVNVKSRRHHHHHPR